MSNTETPWDELSELEGPDPYSGNDAVHKHHSTDSKWVKCTASSNNNEHIYTGMCVSSLCGSYDSAESPANSKRPRGQSVERVGVVENCATFFLFKFTVELPRLLTDNASDRKTAVDQNNNPARRYPK